MVRAFNVGNLVLRLVQSNKDVTEPPNYTKLSKKIHLPGQRSYQT
jgi:hypothetical protein